MSSPRAVLTEPPAPVPPPAGPYELRVAGLRIRWPDGEVVAFGDADLVLPPRGRILPPRPDRAHRPPPARRPRAVDKVAVFGGL